MFQGYLLMLSIISGLVTYFFVRIGIVGVEALILLALSCIVTFATIARIIMFIIKDWRSAIKPARQ